VDTNNEITHIAGMAPGLMSYAHFGPSLNDLSDEDRMCSSVKDFSGYDYMCPDYSQLEEFSDDQFIGSISSAVQGGALKIAAVEGESAVQRVKTSIDAYYYHQDHLGGTSVITDESGNPVQVLDYFPFGSTRIDDQAESYDSESKYTGQKLDAESGIYYYNARYYNQDIGRFLSQDPLALNAPEYFVGDPQQLNMYAYTRNSPLMFNDPKGEALGLLMLAGIVLFGVFFEDIAPANAPAEGDEVVSSGDGSKTIGEVVSPTWDSMPTWTQLVALGVLTQGRSIVKSQAKKWVRGLAKKVSKTLRNNADDALRLWGRPSTLTKHFDDHGADFGAIDEEDYVKKAAKFFSNSQEKNLPTKVDKSGVIRIYESETNTFASYNPDGTVKTFFKPDPAKHDFDTNLEYWEDQAGELIN